MLILFWFSQTWLVTFRIQKKVFSGCTVPTDSNKTKLERSNQKGSTSAGKYTNIVLVPSCTCKCVSTAIFVGVSGCHLLQLINSQWVTKITSRIGVWAYLSVFNLLLNQWIMVILSNECKPDKFESHNSLKQSFQIVLTQILLNFNLSLNQALLTFLLYVRQTWTTQLTLAIFLWRVIFL